MVAKRSNFNWEDLKIFLAVTSSGSVRSAAPLLGINQSTVSRRISALEKEMGTRLFEKLPSGYILTPEGNEVLSYAQRIENEFSALAHHTVDKNSEYSGRIKLTASHSVMSQDMISEISTFCQLYPSISIDFLITDEYLNLSNREADIAIRITKAPPQYVIGRQISNFSYAAYGSNTYLSNFKLPEQTDQLKWIGRNESDERKSKFSSPQHSSTDLETILKATKAGLGASFLPCSIANADPDLCQIPEKRPVITGELWVLMHPELKGVAKIQSFFTFLSQRLLAKSDQFSPVTSSKDDI